MKINPSNFMLAVGQSKQLSAEVNLQDGQINSNVSWASSDNTIASIDSNGKSNSFKRR
ncbi:MAG: hypothetical protein KatS3mg068_1228 [Candidatus Sericytochromatia bacterium]|nr:MAG: hypothetical protein KatS3mg068_1228 [Candidatus Sericytochromatia bacterium]